METIESIPEGGSPILVVDDDIGMLISIEAVLCASGLPQPALLSVSSRALPLIREHEFQIVVLDVMMPDINGLDILRQLRAVFPHICCVMITGSDSDENAVEAIHNGAFGYLVKPFVSQALIELVQEALQNTR